jgi:DNA-binding PadR family transcriptional regulator
MQAMKLTPASYIVLGLVAYLGEATPYELKGIVQGSIGNFWSLQHAQLYTEPERLAKAGFLEERREREGRRRKRYSMTAKGREAVAGWRAQPTAELGELREPALLKLFLGGDPAALAPLQLEAHRRQLAEYESIRAGMPAELPQGPRLALEAGIRHEHTWLAFWEELAGTRASE